MRIRVGTLPVFSALVIACGGVGNQDSGREDSPALGSIGSGLVGGIVVPRGDYSSVVALQFLGADGRIERFCTAVKVGPRAFLTAGHCLLRENSPVAFGTSIVLNSASSSASVRVIKSHVFPSFFNEFLLPTSILPDGTAPIDIGVLEVFQPTPFIAQANVNVTAVGAGAPVTITGRGCEGGLFGPMFLVNPLKAASAVAGVSEAARINAGYFLTRGIPLGGNGSLCPGDSGGAVFLSQSRTSVLAVNAAAEGSNVAAFNFHTRTSAAQDWLSSLNLANVVGIRPGASTQCAPGNIRSATAIGMSSGGAIILQGTVPEPDGVRRATLASAVPFGPEFSGGLRAAAGDINGDGFIDTLVAAGPGGGPHVKVFEGRDAEEIRSFFAYDPSLLTGIHLGSGDVTADGAADIVTGTDQGAPPHVKVFDGRTNAEVRSFYAYATGFVGGVRVAAADVNGDGAADIITGTGPGSDHVKAFNGRDGSLLQSFFAFGGYGGGIYVAGGDVNFDGKADIIVGAGPGGQSQVSVFSGATGALLGAFVAFPGFTGGVTVAASDRNGDGFADITVGAATGPSAHVKAFDGDGLSRGQVEELASFFAFPSGTTNGVTLGSVTCPGGPQPPQPPLPPPPPSGSECTGRPRGALCSGDSSSGNQCDGLGNCVDCVDNGGCNDAQVCDPSRNLCIAGG